MKWVDWSKYQGRVGRDRMLAMKADGVVGICVGSWHGLDANPYAEADLRDGRGVGLLTATYIVVNSRPGREAVALGRRACGGEWQHLSFVAADVEIRGVTEAILRDALSEIAKLGRRTCIYTGNWFWNWWKVDLGHAPDFRAWATWLAYYNAVPDLNVPVAWGLGELVGHQYAGSTPAYGTTVDFNVFDPDWINSEEEEMNQREFNKMFKEAIETVGLSTRDEDDNPTSGTHSLAWWTELFRAHQENQGKHKHGASGGIKRGDTISIEIK